MRKELEAVVRRARRHAFVMTGSRGIGDAVLASALGARTRFVATAPRFEALLYDVYRHLPRHEFKGAFGSDSELHRQLLRLPFYNRGATCLVLLEGLSCTAAADILILEGFVVRHLLNAPFLAA